ncbi:MAG: hypothetical protein ACHQ7M_04495 [Chloroflexota bacterium]
MPNEVGKRYVCAVCSSELLVTKAGAGALSCCGQPMQLKTAGGSGAAAVPPAAH